MPIIQSVWNAAARLVFSARRSDHITPLLRKLHWLKVPERIQFRFGVLAYRCLHNTAPAYLAESLQLVRDVDARGHLRSSDVKRGQNLETEAEAKNNYEKVPNND